MRLLKIVSMAAVLLVGIAETFAGLLVLVPRYRSLHQSASWHEAHEAADAGVNYALQALDEFALGATLVRPLELPAIGLQTGKIEDPYGHVWLLTRFARPAGEDQIA